MVEGEGKSLRRRIPAYENVEILFEKIAGRDRSLNELFVEYLFPLNLLLLTIICLAFSSADHLTESGINLFMIRWSGLILGRGLGRECNGNNE